MFKHALKYAVVALVWRRYRHLIIASAALIVYFWLVGKLHGDFLVYMEVKQNPANVGLSFFVKWLAYVFGFLAYVAYVFIINKEPTEKAPVRTDSTKENSEADPFDDLRKKPSLQSQADKVIAKYPKNKK